MPTLRGLRVAFFGRYRRDYPRNRVLQKALIRSGATVIEMHDATTSPIVSWRLIRAGLSTDYDVVVVGYPGFSSMPAAWLVSRLRRRPVVFDAFLSLYETRVLDRQEIPRWATRVYAIAERVACRLADVVLMDTASHATFLSERTGVPERRFRCVWVGADEEFRAPCVVKGSGEPFTVTFVGNYIPLQGTDVIMSAARLLQEAGEDIRFVMIGNGPTYQAARDYAAAHRLGSVVFREPVPYEALREALCASDVCLGVFGTSPKTGRVIPNKVFDALAVGRPVITGATPAVSAVLRHGEHALLTTVGSAGELAEAILTLKNDSGLRGRLGRAGRQVFEARFSIEAIGRSLGAWLPSLARR